MGPPSLSVEVPAGASTWAVTTASTTSASATEPAMMQVVVEPAAQAYNRWVLLFEGAVPHAAAFLGVPEHMALAASCRALYHAWPQMAGLKTLAIFLDRSALPSSDAVVETPVAAVGKAGGGVTAVAAAAGGSNNRGSNENRDPNNYHVPRAVVGAGRPWGMSGGGGQQQRPWNSLSRLLRHWAPYVETLRFSGAVAGPVEDCLKEALGPALSTPITQPPAPTPGSKRTLPTPAMTRLKTLALPRVGLFPFHAAAVAAFLVGPGGARLETLDLSHNNGLRDEGALAIFRAIAIAAEKATAAEARAAAQAAASGRVVRRRRASSEPTHRLPALRRLDLSYTQLTAAGLRAVVHALRLGAMPNLEALVVSGNPLKDEGGAVLAGMIEAGAFPRLQVLDATACGLGPAETRRLAEAAAANGGFMALRSLVVASNYVDSHGAGALAEAIRAGQLPRLAHLRMDLSGEGPASLLLEALGAGAHGGRGLRRLDLGKNPSLTGATWWRALLPGPQATTAPLAGLEELTLAGCRRLGHHGPAALVRWAEAFGSSAPPALRVLDLSQTGLVGDVALLQGPADGMEAAGPHLARLLGSLPQLESLSLRGNHLGGEGMTCLAKEAAVLGARCRLRILDVAENGLDDTGCLAMAEALAQGAFPALRQLDISGNGIKAEQGWATLLQALATRAAGGQGLEALDVSKNPLGGARFLSTGVEHEALETLLCSGHGLRSLKLACTELDEGNAGALLGLLERHLGGQDDQAMDVDGDEGDRLHSRLGTLELSYNPKLGSETACRLLRLAFGANPHRHRFLPRLQALSLVGTGAGDAAVVEVGWLMGQEDRGWLTASRLELVDLRGNEVGREARVQLQGQVVRLRARLLKEGLCGYTRRLQALVRAGST